jgi:tubulin polyglutamylase TTLL6/13
VCQYPVLRDVIKSFGWEETDDETDWILFWTDCSVCADRVKRLKSYQKINHFPGTSEITRKDNLGRNMNRIKDLFPKEYSFIPRTWVLPHEFFFFFVIIYYFIKNV